MDGVVSTAEVEAACSSGLPAGEAWRPLLLLLPLRLGLSRFHAPYAPCLAGLLGLPQSAGMVGGRPRRSFFFAGVQGAGEDAAAYYYDPHTAQPALGTDGRGARWPLSAADVRSCHCAGLRQMRLTELDPSLALAFLCASRADFERWAEGARAVLRAAGPQAFLSIQPHPIPHAPPPQQPPPAGARQQPGGHRRGGGEGAPSAAPSGQGEQWALTDDEDEDLVLV